jgi:hypothetical protein
LFTRFAGFPLLTRLTRLARFARLTGLARRIVIAAGFTRRAVFTLSDGLWFAGLL